MGFGTYTEVDPREVNETSAYVSARQCKSVYVSVRQRMYTYVHICSVECGPVDFFFGHCGEKKQIGSV